MAPHLEEPIPILDSHIPVNGINGTKKQQQASVLNYVPGRTVTESHEDYAYHDLRPSFPDIKLEALTEKPYVDKGLEGDPQFRNLLASATDVFDYTPKIGTEVSGVRLTQLNDAQKNDLARLIATRGVVFFRSQEDFDIEAQLELGRYFGRLHPHATSAVPKREGLEEVLVVWKGDGSQDMRAMFAPTFLWHSDVSYEVQPPSYTSLRLLTGPPRGGGGDTHWSSQYAAYDVLSPSMQKYLEGLTALHTSEMQDSGTRALGRSVRRDSIETEHPLIRVNPVTGWKSLYYNPGFVTAIVGVPKLESDHIMAYLNEVIATTQENHCRFQWGKYDIALWDNRVCNHTASFGFTPHRRHATRVTVHGERPYFDVGGQSQEEEYNEKYGLPPVDKNGAGPKNYND
ncbi:taurine dioxygenase [Rhizodiscina lignyota]|uniref:Taurine dioxygenase n=1 Tax=Rhizodiscina lignyota TaxID=1504668 RepID=A0A9P4IQA0_9PEZI|nr:taurine dioxygenase [Rhizodiscina lignyota]